MNMGSPTFFAYIKTLNELTENVTPILNAVAATSCDLLFFCS